MYPITPKNFQSRDPRTLLGWLVFVLLTSGYSAYAALGAPLGPNSLNGSLCALEWTDQNVPDPYNEVCTIVHIGKNQFLTAAHCLQNKSQHMPHKIWCRENMDAKLTHTQVTHANFKMANLKLSESFHKFDIALIQVSSTIRHRPYLPVSKTLEQTLQLLSQTSQCAISGFGSVPSKKRNLGHAHAVGLEPSQVQITKEGLIRIHGFGNTNSGLVQIGDSGGSLACYDQKAQSWVHIAQVSGRSMEGYSLMAPTHLFYSQIASQIPLTTKASLIRTRVSDRWLLEDTLLDWSNCQKELEKVLDTYDLDRTQFTLPTTPLSKSCASQKKAIVQHLFKQNIKSRFRVRPYSLVTLDLNVKSIQLDQNRSNERILMGSNPFSIVDHEYAFFIPSHLDSEFAYGTLQILGHSEHFPCKENILCAGGQFLNSKIDLFSLEAH